MKKVLITGSNGQLGRELTKQLRNHNNIELILTDQGELDISNSAVVYFKIKDIKPDIIINCAAYTNVDKCETDINMAYKINTIGPKNLAQAAFSIGAELVQISTDYVFDGEATRPITEFDKPSPQTIYGNSKFFGENVVKELNPKSYIIRTAWLYGDGNNFVKTMIDLSKTNKSLKVVNDQHGTPTSTVDLAKVIIKLIEEKNYGLFHCTCKGETTWYEFTKEIFRLKGIDTELIPCTTKEFPRPAKRPNYSVLDNYMLKLTTGDITRTWEEALDEYIKKLYK